MRKQAVCAFVLVMTLAPCHLNKALALADSGIPSSGASLSAHDCEPLTCLAELRSAIAQYFADNGSTYPNNLSDQLVPKYLPQIPALWKNFREDGATPPHPVTSEIMMYTSRSAAVDTGKWGYVYNPGDPSNGSIFIDCNHLNWRKYKWNTF